MPDEKESGFSIKDLLTVVPVAGIILAVLYDIGYFIPIDPSLFTLFSWSDHIGFALGALVPAIILVSALGWSLSTFTFDAPLNHQRRIRLWFLFVLFGFAALGAVLTGRYAEAVFWMLMWLITLSAIFFKVWLSGIILAYSLGLIFGASAIGFTDAQGALHSPAQQLLVTTSNQMQGRVFRSGDRGMLFYDNATKMMNFLLWSEVKRLETVVTNPRSEPADR